MDKKVLVDTSIWVEYFRKKDVQIYATVNNLMDSNLICSSSLIIAELMQGAKSDIELNIIKDLYSLIPILPDNKENWFKAGSLSYKLRRKGKTIGLSDCYIAVIANENKTYIYTLDKHFADLKSFFDIDIL